MKKVVLYVVMASMILCNYACSEAKELEEEIEMVCEEVACTAIYMHISLKLEYPNGQPVLLDKSSVFWVSKKRFLEQDLVTWNEGRIWGNYNIVNDKMQKELLNKREIMHFTGYLNGKVVCERDVLVGADCCHVIYLGDKLLTQVIK